MTFKDVGMEYKDIFDRAKSVIGEENIVEVIGSSPTNPTKQKAPESQVNQGFPGFFFAPIR